VPNAGYVELVMAFEKEFVRDGKLVCCRRLQTSPQHALSDGAGWRRLAQAFCRSRLAQDDRLPDGAENTQGNCQSALAAKATKRAPLMACQEQYRRCSVCLQSFRGRFLCPLTCCVRVAYPLLKFSIYGPGLGHPPPAKERTPFPLRGGVGLEWGAPPTSPGMWEWLEKSCRRKQLT
jgi:hypothetical protein